MGCCARAFAQALRSSRRTRLPAAPREDARVRRGARAAPAESIDADEPAATPRRQRHDRGHGHEDRARDHRGRARPEGARGPPRRALQGICRNNRRGADWALQARAPLRPPASGRALRRLPSQVAGLRRRDRTHRACSADGPGPWCGSTRRICAAVAKTPEERATLREPGRSARAAWRRPDADRWHRPLLRAADCRRVWHRHGAVANVETLHVVADARTGQQDLRRQGAPRAVTHARRPRRDAITVALRRRPRSRSPERRRRARGHAWRRSSPRTARATPSPTRGGSRRACRVGSGAAGRPVRARRA
jgi:hypothetical protein